MIYAEEAYNIIGAAMEVHRILGPGFLEAVYHEALEVEMRKRGIPFETKVALPIQYKDVVLKKCYEADLYCYDKIIVELKAVSEVTSEHEAQILNYMKATGCELGLLINFGSKELYRKRYLNTK